MAKPRKQKSGEQQQQQQQLQSKAEESLVGGTVLHQKLCLSIDMQKRRIYGHTEMKIVVPESGIIGLHADNMAIGSILVNGEPAEFEFFPNYQHVDDQKWNSVSCFSSAADAACGTYISSLEREMVPNLLIACSKAETSADNPECELNGRDESRKSPGEFEHGLSDSDHATQQNIKLVRINYCVERGESGIHFWDNVLCTSSQIRRAHCWFPCMDSSSQRCCYDLEFTVDINFVAVSNGSLLYQILSNDDPPRKTYIYKLSVPVSAAWISLAVAPFEIFPDSHNSLLSHMCLPGNAPMLRNTVGFFHTAFSHYEDYLSVPFPFGSYKQVFVPPELLVSSASIGASMCIFSSDVLFDEKVIDKTIDTRIKLAHILARQWFGGYIIAETPSDEWLLDGLAGFLTDLFIRRFLGNNEARYRRYKANHAVCQVDVSGATALSSSAASEDLYGTQSIGLYGRIRSWKAVSVLQMLEKQMGPESFRKILQLIVQDSTRSFRSLSSREFRHLANKVGNLERPFLKEFFPRWVGSCGCPVLRLGLSYIKRKNMIELAVMRSSTATFGSAFSDNENREGDTSWPGMMSVRVHELDGMYDHPSLPMSGETLQLLEIQLHSKLASKRFQKPKKGAKPDGSDDNNDAVSVLDVRTCMDSPLLWIRVDPEMEYLAEVHFHQPVQMWINQLEKDKDVVAQSEAIVTLKTLPQLSFSVVNALNNFLNDSKAFWRVRIEAAFALAHTSSEEPAGLPGLSFTSDTQDIDWAGLLHLVKFYKSRRFDADIGLPKPNNFHDVPEYFVLEAIPLAIATVRAPDKKSPREAVEFILHLLKYNDNNGNPYSDVYWLATLVQSIGELEFGKQNILFLSSLLKRIDRLLQFDRLMPSYNGILTISCIRSLAQIALKIPASIPLEQVFDLIKSFRSFDKWKVRIEANKSLINLEFYRKGLDAALLIFLKFLDEEHCFRGQVKLAVHMMHLCEANNDSESISCIKNSTLISLLSVLASRKSFNNIFLRHHLFCILQIVAGRPPTLYGVPRVPLKPMVDGEAFNELKMKTTLLKARISRPQEPIAEPIVNTPTIPDVSPIVNAATIHDGSPIVNTATIHDGSPVNTATIRDGSPIVNTTTLPDVLPIVEAVKDTDTVSNSNERRVLKIRVKQPAASGKAEGTDNVIETSRGWHDETDLGPSSSVSVDAPPRPQANERQSVSIQILEEVNSSHDHESRTTASVGSAKLVNSDDVGKELQCTADSVNGALPEDRSSPTFRRSDGDGDADAQKSSCAAPSFRRQDDVKPPVMAAQESKGKEKKHRERKRKRGDKNDDNDRHNDPEYLERKRLKKEKRRREKELAKLQSGEAMRSSVELQNVQGATDLQGHPPLTEPKKSVGTVETAVPKIQENGSGNPDSNTSTKVRIKIKSRSILNS